MRNSPPPGRSPMDDASTFKEVLDSSGLSKRTIDRFRQIIYGYYAENGRDLPWRHTTDPYCILVSEIMLQQTQVERVVKKYPEFIAAFPTCSDLAKAPLSRVLSVWQGMGYNRRAIALVECAVIMSDEYSGMLPMDSELLATFPGIGKATARSILAFAFNEPVVFIETNIRRVFIHFFFQGAEGISDRDIAPLVEKTLDQKNPRAWYSALMDYGSMIRTNVANPNHRSTHYKRQPAFEGSDRQIRGIVIRCLLGGQGLTEEELREKTGCRKTARLQRIIAGLVADGFCKQVGRKIWICDERS